jgi:hypothetical protein
MVHVLNWIVSFQTNKFSSSRYITSYKLYSLNQLIPIPCSSFNILIPNP